MCKIVIITESWQYDFGIRFRVHGNVLLDNSVELRVPWKITRNFRYNFVFFCWPAINRDNKLNDLSFFFLFSQNFFFFNIIILLLLFTRFSWLCVFHLNLSHFIFNFCISLSNFGATFCCKLRTILFYIRYYFCFFFFWFLYRNLLQSLSSISFSLLVCCVCAIFFFSAVCKNFTCTIMWIENTKIQKPCSVALFFCFVSLCRTHSMFQLEAVFNFRFNVLISISCFFFLLLFALFFVEYI